jgi:hypothetical protein
LIWLETRHWRCYKHKRTACEIGGCFRNLQDYVDVGLRSERKVMSEEQTCRSENNVFCL